MSVVRLYYTLFNLLEEGAALECGLPQRHSPRQFGCCAPSTAEWCAINRLFHTLHTTSHQWLPAWELWYSDTAAAKTCKHIYTH